MVEKRQPIIRRRQDAQDGCVLVQKASGREMTTQESSGRSVNPTLHPERQFASRASRASDAQDAQDASNNFCWCLGLEVRNAEESDNLNDWQTRAKNQVTLQDRTNRDYWVQGWDWGWRGWPHWARRQYLAMVCRPCLVVRRWMAVGSGIVVRKRIVVQRGILVRRGTASASKLKLNNWGCNSLSVRLQFSHASILWINRCFCSFPFFHLSNMFVT